LTFSYIERGRGRGRGERSFTSERLQSWGGTLEAVRRRHRGHRRCQARFLVAPPLRPVRCAARLETTSWKTMFLPTVETPEEETWGEKE
jgi:hypothetical protein